MISLSSLAGNSGGKAIAQQKRRIAEKMYNLAGNAIAILFLGVDRRGKYNRYIQGSVFGKCLVRRTARGPSPTEVAVVGRHGDHHLQRLRFRDGTGTVPYGLE